MNSNYTTFLFLLCFAVYLLFILFNILLPGIPFSLQKLISKVINPYTNLPAQALLGTCKYACEMRNKTVSMLARFHEDVDQKAQIEVCNQNFITIRAYLVRWANSHGMAWNRSQ